MITKKQYEKALAVVKQYHEQLNKPAVTGKFKILLADISFNINGFSCTKIKHLTDEQHEVLYKKLQAIGKTVSWSNTEEMNYLNVSWVGTDGVWNKKEREAICKILNCL